MKQNKYPTEYPNGFLSGLLDRIAEAVVVVDSGLTVCYINHAAEELFGTMGQVPPDTRLGQLMQCRESENACQPAHEVICSNCKIRTSATGAIGNHSDQPPVTMVIQPAAEKTDRMKLIRFQTGYFSFNGKDFAVLTINDLTQLGQAATRLT